MQKNLFIATILAIGTLALTIGSFAWTGQASQIRQIVVFLPSASNPFWIEVRHGIEEKAKQLGSGYNISIMASGDLDATSQLEQLKSILDRKAVDAIVIGVANNRAPAPVIAEYNAAKIPVVMIDTKLDEKAAKESGATWNAFIGSDNRLGGYKAGETMAKALAEKENHRVLLIKGSYIHQSAIDRAEGFIDGAGKKLEILEREGEWSRQRATEITTGVMTRDPVGGIFASNDDMALGAVAALKNIGLSDKEMPVIIGFDATPAGIEAIERGEMYASVKQDAAGMGAAGVSLAVDILNGHDFKKETLIPVQVATKSSKN